MRTNRERRRTNRIMKKLLTVLCLVLLSSYSYSQEVVTGPFLIRDGITYHQDTNELVTGIVLVSHSNCKPKSRMNFKNGKLDGLYESFHENGQLEYRGNFKNGKEEGLREYFDVNGNPTKTENYKDGELIE